MPAAHRKKTGKVRDQTVSSADKTRLPAVGGVTPGMLGDRAARNTPREVSYRPRYTWFEQSDRIYGEAEKVVEKEHSYMS